MKNLIQYSYSCTEAMHNYMQGNISKDQLISIFKEIEQHHRNEINDNDSDKGFWFNFFESDTLATTIRDIDNCLSLPQHSNYEYMITNFEIAINDAGLKVYYS